ncbi:ribonuclease HIII [Verrucomicrobiota bacterium]
MAVQNSYSYKLSEEKQNILSSILKNGNYKPIHIPYTKFAAETNNCKIALYQSGKCVIQGKGAADFVTFVLEPLVVKEAQLGYEDILNQETAQPHMGIDESGKGDFFGPLVVAGAYVDQSIIQAMREMGVRDSKRITSDNKALGLGRELRKLLGKKFSLVKIGPEAYNKLYSKMRNVNTILSWAHARAIENLLDVVPDCPRAISDQFGKKEQVIQALMKKGRKIKLIQQHKAEEDLAVAAASILARAEFIRSLKKMEQNYEISIPKGASTAVQDAGVELIKKHGPGILLKTAKCHFKTTDIVLQKMKIDRSALGPEGQAVSKAKKWSR